MFRLLSLCHSACILSLAAAAALGTGALTEQADVGNTGAKGTAFYLPASDTYRVGGAGAGLTGIADSLHFLYTQASGDVTISSQVAWDQASGAPTQAAALMIRQSLEPDAPFAAVLTRRNGTAVLAYRPSAGVPAAEFRLAWKAPTQLTLQRRGNEMAVTAGDRTAHPADGGPVIVSMAGPVFVGVATASGKAGQPETVLFTHLQVKASRAALTPPIDLQLIAEHGAVWLPAL